MVYSLPKMDLFIYQSLSSVYELAPKVTYTPIIDGKRSSPEGRASIVAFETLPEKTSVEFIDGLYFYKPLHSTTNITNSRSVQPMSGLYAPIGAAFSLLKREITEKWLKIIRLGDSTLQHQEKILHTMGLKTAAKKHIEIMSAADAAAKLQFERLESIYGEDVAKNIILQGETAVPDQPESSDSPRLKMPQVSTLGKQISELFNKDELRDLMRKLSIDYENLSGDNKLRKAQELVEYANRRGKVSELLEILREERPRETWSIEAGD